MSHASPASMRAVRAPGGVKGKPSPTEDALKMPPPPSKRPSRLRETCGTGAAAASSSRSTAVFLEDRGPFGPLRGAVRRAWAPACIEILTQNKYCSVNGSFIFRHSCKFVWCRSNSAVHAISDLDVADHCGRY